MPIIDARTMMTAAYQARIGLGAFNLTSFEQIEAFVAAAERAQSPIIVQVTGPVVGFLGPEAVVGVFDAIANRYGIPLFLHLDHNSDPDLISRAIRAGFGSVMFDGSHYPLEENIERTREVVSKVRSLGKAAGRYITVEAELGAIGGAEDGAMSDGSDESASLCDPADAVRFVKETGIDLFAPAIGTVHGFYKTADPHIDFERVTTIESALREAGMPTPLVVHGGTGLPEKTFRALIAAGYVKVNISTVLKKTLIDTAFEYISGNRREYDPTAIDMAVRDATIDCVEEHIDFLGSRGSAKSAFSNLDTAGG